MPSKLRVSIGWILIGSALWTMYSGGGGFQPVSTAPFPADRLCVLIVEQTEDRDDYPRSQVDAITSTIWREYVESKGGDIRDLEPAATLINEAEWVPKALAVPRESLPWLVISDGKTGYTGPFPENLDAFMAKLKEIGG